jgi:hypothetical protein
MYQRKPRGGVEHLCTHALCALVALQITAIHRTDERSGAHEKFLHARVMALLTTKASTSVLSCSFAMFLFSSALALSVRWRWVRFIALRSVAMK